MKAYHLLLIASGICLFSCTGRTESKKEKDMNTFEKGTFGYDLNYLSQRDSLIVLTGNNGKAQVIVSAKYQAKVFTSSADGLEGKSLGYVGYKAFEVAQPDEHMNGYGGENRFWLGPEGGQFSVYFKPSTEQVFENWHTPKPIDIEAWDVVSSDQKTAFLKKEMEVVNYKGTHFKLKVDRNIHLLEPAEINALLGIQLNGRIKSVAYTTNNIISNLNDFEWTKETGTICTWMLDMFHPAPNALTIVPFHEGDSKELGKIATTDYFGEIPADRLKINKNVLYLKTDGKYRSKLGLNAKRTITISGNYDPDAKRLTINTFNVDKDAIYLNQECHLTRDPGVGDALNAYNDGPLADGSIMGPFFEIESCSPAAFLKPNQSLSHQHNVFHFIVEESELTKITEKLLGVSIDEIKSIF